MEYKEIHLKKGKEESIDRFHPWVFSGAIESSSGAVDDGDKVRVYSKDGRLLGTGHYQKSSIAVRILDFSAGELDESFYRRRICDAWQLRKSLGIAREGTDCYRLIHGEGDFVPGLVVDVYGCTAVMQAHSAGIHFDRRLIASSIAECSEGRVRNVYYKSETTLPFKESLEAENEYLIGKYEGNIAMENGLKFHVDWLKGQKTGFFVDQRENRALLGMYSRGRSVLNMFCYTGGFSVYALAGGAKEVVSVDSSAKAISLTEQNVELNFPNESRHRSEATDAFKYLDQMEKDRYDLIVLDPPAFAKHRGAIPNALRGYQKLNVKAMQKIRKGGILFTFSCSQAISREQFRLAVMSASVSSGRKVRISHQLSQPADHPVNIYHPEGEYLKGLVLYIE